MKLSELLKTAKYVISNENGCARMYGRKDIFRKMNWGRDAEVIPGGTIPVRTEKGTFTGIWGGVAKQGERINGHARVETLQAKWLNKGWKLVDIPGIEMFAERNTLGKQLDQLVRFQMPDGHVIRGIARVEEVSPGKKILHVKVITEPASGGVERVHGRMPLVRLALHPEKE